MNQNAVQARIRIQPGQQRQQFVLCGGLWEDVGFREKAQTLARLFLHPDVNFRCGILAHTNEGESGLDAARQEGGDALAGFRVELIRDGPSVDEVRQHCNYCWGTTSMESMLITGVLGQRSSRISSPVTMTRCSCMDLTVMLVFGLKR